MALLSTLGRFSIWKTDLLALRAHPWLGYGLGNFEYAFMKFHQPSAEFLRYAKTTIFAHNGILQTAVEAGVPAVFFLLWGFRNAAALFRSSHTQPASSIGFLWYFMGLLVYAITSLFNYSLFLPFNGLVFSACLGLSVQGCDDPNEPGVPIRSFQALLKSFLIFFCCFLLLLGISDQYAQAGRFDVAVRFMPIKSEYWYQLALHELENGPRSNYDRALLYLKRAALWDSHNPFVWSRIARVLNAQQNISNHPAIEAAFQKAEEISPKHAPFWVEHGFYSLSVHDWTGGQSNFQRAALLEPSTPLPLYGLGVVSMHDQQFSEALRFFSSAKSMKENQSSVEGRSAYNRELLSAPYGEYLYSVDITLIDKLMAECAAQIHPSTLFK